MEICANNQQLASVESFADRFLRLAHNIRQVTVIDNSDGPDTRFVGCSNSRVINFYCTFLQSHPAVDDIFLASPSQEMIDVSVAPLFPIQPSQSIDAPPVPARAPVVPRQSSTPSVNADSHATSTTSASSSSTSVHFQHPSASTTATDSSSVAASISASTIPSASARTTKWLLFLFHHGRLGGDGYILGTY